MVSQLAFYVCAIGLYILTEARHTRPLNISKESIKDLKENYRSVELNKRIDGAAKDVFTQGYTKRVEPSKIKKYTMGDKGVDAASNKGYRSRRDSHLKCARSKHEPCDILRNRISRHYERKKALRQRDLMRSWDNQLRAMEKFLDHVKETERERKKKSDFEMLLEDIEMKRTRETTETAVTTADESKAEECVDVYDVIDEIDVRAALKSSPLIRRILKMGRKRRDKFFRDLDKNNIRVSKGRIFSPSLKSPVIDVGLSRLRQFQTFDEERQASG